jgi:hypothetical protein
LTIPYTPANHLARVNNLFGNKNNADQVIVNVRKDIPIKLVVCDKESRPCLRPGVGTRL